VTLSNRHKRKRSKAKQTSCDGSEVNQTRNSEVSVLPETILHLKYHPNQLRYPRKWCSEST
jgi:hypothetical protein